jgi:hypothetical protein
VLRRRSKRGSRHWASHSIPRKSDLSLGATVLSYLRSCGNHKFYEVLISRHFTLDLQGEIKEGTGLDPQLYVSVYLNGCPGASTDSTEQTLCAGEISQKGVPLSDGQTLTDCNVMIRYGALLLDTELKEGYYTARVEMYASEEVGKARMTGFEGGVWIEGGKGDGCGGCG